MSNMQSMTFRKILNLAAAGVEKHNELKRLMAVVLVCGTLGLYAQSRTTGFCDQELYLRNYPCSGARFLRTRSVEQYRIVDIMDPYCVKLVPPATDVVSHGNKLLNSQPHRIEVCLLVLLLTSLMLYWKRVNSK